MKTRVPLISLLLSTSSILSNWANAEDNKIKIDYIANPPTFDLVMTIPGSSSPSFRALCPEWIIADKIDLLKRAQTALNFNTPFHCAPVKFTKTGNLGSYSHY